MNTSERTRCRKCGAMIPERSTEELCPACLMSGVLEPSRGEAETFAPAASRAQSTYELSEFPCEFGGYRLLGLLGKGGMGTVYEAEQLSTGRRVALKMLSQQLDSPEMRRRFLREGRLAAGVSHPNSLYVFGSEEVEGLPVITMEIASSGTLQDRLEQRGPMPVTEAVDAILDVVSGLESASSAGVLHRDIKPSNCFVGPDGSVKVGDFGLSVSTLARKDTFVTTVGRIMGTPAFASPEQLRGDVLDSRADIYSVGATLFALLTGRPPFKGENAVQVVVSAVNEKPRPLSEIRQDVPSGLEKVVARCLAKEPDQRYDSYAALRNALLPFSSRDPEPASIKVRTSAGWIDYLIAFMVPYVVLMIVVGGEELLITPLIERTFYSARYYLILVCAGLLYFTIVEGFWGAGLGKRLKGLLVVRSNGGEPGLARALLRILIPIASVEVLRVPLSMAVVSDPDLDWSHVVLFIIIANLCGWIPLLLTLGARRENGFATVWDRASGTRVVVKPEGTVRPWIEAEDQAEIPDNQVDRLGPYEIIEELIPKQWIVAADPVLRRQVWLLKRNSVGPCAARRSLARSSRLRWLQKVESAGTTWDAYEAVQGSPFSSLVQGGSRIPWTSLRHWLHDLASEMWAASGDQTLPVQLSIDHIWIAERGSVVLLDEPWPGSKPNANPIAVGDLPGQQRFLNAVAENVEPSGVPLHAWPVLKNLREGKYEKLSFLTGILRGLLDRPADVSRGIRAGSLFMLPLYIWVLFLVGVFRGGGVLQWKYSLSEVIIFSSVLLLCGAALIQLVEIPFKQTISQAIFRLAVVSGRGLPASRVDLLVRWVIVWLPLLLPLSFVGLLFVWGETTVAFLSAVVLLTLWLGGSLYGVIHPHRGLHDRLAGTWVVRQ